MITMNNNQGLWVSIDGCECAGKTTLVNKIKESYPDVLIAPEFSDSFLGKWLKNEVITTPFEVTSSVVANSLLFLSDYFEIQAQIIEPALKDGKIVISDRGFLSKLAVQFVIMEDEYDQKAKVFLESLFELSLRPSLSIILDTTDDIIHNRIVERCGSCDQNRLDINKRTNDMLRYFANRLELTHECLSFDDAEDRLKKIILNR